MSGTFILPESVDLKKETLLLEKICKFILQTLPTKKGYCASEVCDSIGGITTIDKQFIIEHGDDFGTEMREIGTMGLFEKYKERPCIHVYGEIPHWLIDMMNDMFNAQYIYCKCRDKSRW